MRHSADSEMHPPKQLLGRNARQSLAESSLEPLEERVEMLSRQYRERRPRFPVQPAQKLPEHAAFRSVMDKSDRWCNERIQDLFDCRPAFGRPPFIFVQKVQPLLIEGPETPQNHGFKQGILRFEVVVNGRQIDVRCSNNRSKRCTCKSLVGEHLLRNVQDPLFRIWGTHTNDSIIRLNDCQEMKIGDGDPSPILLLLL